MARKALRYMAGEVRSYDPKRWMIRLVGSRELETRQCRDRASGESTSKCMWQRQLLATNDASHGQFSQFECADKLPEDVDGTDEAKSRLQPVWRGRLCTGL